MKVWVRYIKRRLGKGVKFKVQKERKSTSAIGFDMECESGSVNTPKKARAELCNWMDVQMDVQPHGKKNGQMDGGQTDGWM
jgi:hypothetical protein